MKCREFTLAAKGLDCRVRLCPQVFVSNQSEPGKDPDEAESADDLKGYPPAPGLICEHGFHNQRGQDCADGSAALQNAVAHGPVRRTEQTLGGLQAARPVAGLKQTQQGSAD